MVSGQLQDNLTCPVCGYKFTPQEEADFVDYHSDDEPQECPCDKCGVTFYLKQLVIRRFRVAIAESDLT